MASSVELKWDEAKLAKIQKNIMVALIKLGEDTAYCAQTMAPVDSGALVTSIRSSQLNDSEVVVLAGGKANGKYVPYARFREYHNNLHPSTRFYMRNALDWAGNNIEKYFKDITK